jgi:Rod binding domain-containing protein
MYEELMYDEIAKSMAASGGIGMANVLYQQMKDVI